MGLIPSIEQEHNGITHQIKQVFSSLSDDPTIKMVIKKNMELSNYLMNKCIDINNMEKQTQQQSHEIEQEHSRIKDLRYKIEKEYQELKRQTEIYSKCKSSLLMTITDLDTSIAKEINTLSESNTVKDKINIWENKTTKI